MPREGTPVCRYYFEQKAVPRCEILVSLNAAGSVTARGKMLRILDDMRHKGGGPHETTRCQFRDHQRRCPHYAP